MKLTIIGQGYIGLPTSALFAANGFDVAGYDVNKAVVDGINKGQVHIKEPDLDGLVANVTKQKKLIAYHTPQPADAFIITVPTPIDHATNKPDMSLVMTAGKTIAPILKNGNLVILESTSTVGSTEALAKTIYDIRSDLAEDDILFAYCPERVLPGRILTELIHNDRIVGGLIPQATDAAAELYGSIVRGEIFKTDAPTAEMVKLTENAYRDVNIAFANELSLISSKLNLNVWEVIKLANRHPRVNVLSPGAGVGGHCIAVDPWFIVDSAPDEAKLIRQSRLINDGKRDWVVEQVTRIASQFKKPNILCLGLAFKPDVDDIRESPALYVAEELAKRKIGQMTVIEPHLKQAPNSLKTLPFANKVTIDMLANANIILPLVKHRAFHAIKPPQGAIVLDICGLFA